ncbi:hypothetical protein K8S19_05525 [bacterium]|nr:hypothetical protein [bacterium]
MKRDEDVAGKVKGSGISFILKRIKAQGAELEKAFLETLSPTEQTIFQTALPIAWIDLAIASKIYANAAVVLHPHHPKGVLQIAREVAISDMTGIYKVLLRFATIPMIMEKASQLWSVNHSRGRARVEKDPRRNAGDFIVEDYPGLSPVYRDVTTGYIQGVLELSHKQNIRVLLDGKDPARWRWMVSWN